MRGFDESFTRLAADALRGRIGRDQFGMFGLELFQLVHQPVEFRVRDFGIIEHVVAVLVMANIFSQALNVVLDFRHSHRRLFQHIWQSCGCLEFDQFEYRESICHRGERFRW